jgi:uncharacterized protein (DUF697 family)
MPGVVPHALRQALNHQRQMFAKLPGAAPHFVPLDFTLPEDGLPPPDYGLDALLEALERASVEAFDALRVIRSDDESDAIRSKARPLIYGHAAAAAGAGGIPVPFVGEFGVATAIALMLRVLASRYYVAWTSSRFASFIGAIGTGTLMWSAVSFGGRELLKLVPVVGALGGGALNAAAAFALTAGMGESACVWFSYERRGQTAPDEKVREAFKKGVAEALLRAKHRKGRRVGDLA